MVRFLLVVEVSDAGDQRIVSLLLSPGDRVGLGPGCVQDVVGMILNHIIVDWAMLGATFGTCFDVDVSHCSSVQAGSLFGPSSVKVRPLDIASFTCIIAECFSNRFGVALCAAIVVVLSVIDAAKLSTFYRLSIELGERTVPSRRLRALGD
jgi:hypothetical protein